MKTARNVKLAAAAKEFIAEPSEIKERELLDLLNKQLKLEEFAELSEPFIEYGCVEHNVVHVLHADGQACIEISPVSGRAVAIM